MPHPGEDRDAGVPPHQLVRSVPTHAEPVDAPWAADRLGALIHELANLLDGSSRCVALARHAAATPRPDVHALDKKLAAVQSAMEQMTTLVRSAMRGVSPIDGRGSVGLMDDRPLGEVIEHAVEVMAAAGFDRGIGVRCSIGPGVSDRAARGIYPALAAGLRNALEAVQTRRDRPEKAGVELRAELRDGRISIEIVDDGVGPPRLPESELRGLMELGRSTKPGGSGIGLALARDVVTALGGDIRLQRRSEAQGSVLLISYPAPPPARA